MKIDGGCHCEAIRFVLQWPASPADMTVRACGCTFCIKHGGSWTAHREAELAVEIRNPPLVSKYRFGTKTAEFYVCCRCGVVPFVTSDIDDCTYAVVNVNAFEAVDVASLPRASASFDGEGTGDRLERRKRNWIPRVRFSVAA